ncbi:glutamyl-tRNA reductase [Brachybacterium epidermidis]|uniref:glutamyl-tRNA reductase n=1 Tax=Brachybacterium epidermidis TaxID=2781983 RepID=UPI00398EA4AF
MLVAVRASHEHLDLGVLDALTRNSEQLPRELNAPGAPLDGMVMLSTCNRLELYLDAERFHDAVDHAMAAVSRTSGLAEQEVRQLFEAAMGTEVAQHLYEVTAGLRSVVMGESEVAGQVRAAFTEALEQGTTTPMLNDLFQEGLRQAKRVSSSTRLGAAGRTGAAVALDRAIEVLEVPLAEASVLVIGTGSYARLVVAELARRGVQDVSVFSSTGRAPDFAASHGVRAIQDDGLAAAAAGADLVVAASGNGQVLLHAEHLSDARPRVILDLALHSDLDAAVRELEGVRVIGLADLADDIEDAGQLAAAREILTEGVDRFVSRQETRKLDPAVTALRGRVAEALDQEIREIRERYSEDVAADLERRLQRIASRVLHLPTARARELARAGAADQYVEAMHTLFGIDLGEPDERPTLAVPDDKAPVELRG